MTSQYYRNAECAIIVYDTTKLNTFKAVKYWLKELKENCTNPNIVVMLIGNKVDLINRRAVNIKEAKNFAEKNDLYYIETSAQDSTNVNKAFSILIETTYNKLKSRGSLTRKNSKMGQQG